MLISPDLACELAVAEAAQLARRLHVVGQYTTIEGNHE
jgi:hypothetical protein